MSEAASALRETAVPAPARAPVARHEAWRAAAYALALAFAIGWTLALGQDLHWDAFNYHVYLGFSALNDRLAVDFFAAGPPSYLNPYAFVPLYLMVASGWGAIEMALAYAVAHAAALALVYEIALVGAAGPRTRQPQAFALLAMLLAAVNPLLLQTLGTTFADLTVGVPVIGGWLAVALFLRRGRLAWAIVAGVLLGAAAGLKLSNAMFALAAAIVLAFLGGEWRLRLRAVAAFVAACGAALAVAALPWAMKLWHEFGNPFFPLLNHVFGSPDFTSEALRYERFMADSWIDALLRPFAMLRPASYVHTELRSPDLRYVALLAAIAAWAGTTMARRRVAIGGSGANSARDAGHSAADRVLAGLLLGLAVSWVAWLHVSGNSRYFLPMSCVAGAVLALVLQRLHLRHPDATAVAIALLVLVQGMQIVLGSDWKRDGRNWDGQWLAPQVPPRLRDEPALYLSLGFQTGSALLPFLHKDAAMMNVSGFQEIAPGRPGGQRAELLIRRHRGRVRMLIPLPSHERNEGQALGRASQLSPRLARFGLEVDPTDCEIIRVDGSLRGVIETPPAGAPVTNARPQIRFVTCRLVEAPKARAAYERAVRPIDVVFDRVEDACPNLFHPRRPATEFRTHFVRTYNMGSEMHLWVDSERVKYFRPTRGGDPIDIGSVSEWTERALSFDCTRKSAPAFGGILE